MMGEIHDIRRARDGYPVYGPEQERFQQLEDLVLTRAGLLDKVSSGELQAEVLFAWEDEHLITMSLEDRFHIVDRADLVHFSRLPKEEE